MKPIEPGCLALYTGGVWVTGPEFGREAPAHQCRVFRHLAGDNEPHSCGRAKWWLVSDPGAEHGRSAVCECKLVRIDGDPDEVEQADKREVVA